MMTNKRKRKQHPTPEKHTNQRNRKKERKQKKHKVTKGTQSLKETQANQKKSKSQAYLELALLNIENQSNKLPELELVLTGMKYKPHLLAVTETKENYFSLEIKTLKGFTFFGKPVEYDILTSTPQGGVGFWVANSIVDRASIFTPKIENENILWIQIHGKLLTCYLCVTYSRPNNQANHDGVLDSLIMNHREIALLGPVTILADFNAHVTDKTESQIKTGPKGYDRSLTRFLKLSDLTPLRASAEEVKNNQHWTYHGHNKSQSVNDYILTQTHNTSPTFYHVHQDINIGSTHRLITARIEFQRQKATWTWGKKESYYMEWTNTTVSQYQNTVKSNTRKTAGIMDKILKLPIRDQIQQLAEYISNTLIASMQPHAAHTPAKTDDRKHHKTNKGLKPKHPLCTLLQNKRALLKQLTRTKHKDKTTIITRINAIQALIRDQSQQTNRDSNEQWWTEINRMKFNSPHTVELFWKLARKLNPNTKQSLPTMFKSTDDTPLTTANSILSHIQGYYEDISTDNDKSATDELINQNISPEALSRRKDAYEAEFRELIKTLKGESTTETEQDHPPTEEEIEEAIDEIKNKKTPGYDHITAEMLKYAPPCIREFIYIIIGLMWSQSITPTHWNIAITTLLFKKGDRHRITNYRPITLLSTLFKVWEKILDRRIRKIVTELIPYPQMGSLKHNSSTLATLTMKLLLLKAKREGRTVFSVQVDMNKAYNRVKRKPLWSKLHRLGIKGLLLKAIMSTYDSATEYITIGNTPSRKFSLDNGLRQGSIISPILYLIDNIDLLTELIGSNTGIQTGDESIQRTPAIMFVDDLNTLTDEIKKLEQQLQIINNNSWTCGGIVNYGKSTTASTLETTTFSPLIDTDRIKLRITEIFIHLGNKYALSRNPQDNTMSEGAKHRLSRATTILNTMVANGLNGMHICPTKTTHIITKTVMVTLTYGLTHEELTGTDKQAFKRFVGKTIKHIYNITCSKHPDDWLILEANIPNPTDLIIMNDIAAILKCKEKGTNPLCRAVITSDRHFLHRVTTNCLRWKTSLLHIEPITKKKRRKFLISKAKQYRISHYTNHSETRSLKQMGIFLKHTAYERLNLNKSLAGLLMKARGILHHHDPQCNTICPYCTTNELHTITHIITRCDFQLTKATRDQFNNQLTSGQTSPGLLNELNIHQITSALGGPPLPEWSDHTQSKMARACLLVLQTSPLLFPPNSRIRTEIC